MFLEGVSGANVVFRKSASVSVLRAGQTQTGVKNQAEREAARVLAGRIDEARAQLVELRDTLSSATLRRARTSVASISGIDLGLSVVNATSSGRTAEEINAETTGVNTRQPSWYQSSGGRISTGDTTTPLIVSGSYTGTDNASFRFTARITSDLGGARNLILDVYKNSSRTDRLTFDRSSYTAGTPVSIGDGLSIALDTGSQYANEYAEFEAQVGVNPDLDPDLAFNGVGASDPELEEGEAIVDGSFLLNGVEIEVYANDTLNTVMDRVNSSGAGVTMSLSGDRLTVRADDPGATEINFTDDTSGFVSAMKLDSLAVVEGSTDETAEDLSEVEVLAGIVNGSFEVNGVEITVDPTVDSLADVIERINSSGAGVEARFSQSTGSLVITASERSGAVTVGADSSGLLTRAGISAGTTEGRSTPGVSRRTTTRLAEQMAAALTPLAALGNPVSGAQGNGVTARSQDVIRDRITELLGADGGEQVLGFSLSLEGGSIQFGDSEQSDFKRALRSRPGQVLQTLVGAGGSGGFLDQLIGALDAVKRKLGQAAGGLVSSRA